MLCYGIDTKNIVLVGNWEHVIFGCPGWDSCCPEVRSEKTRRDFIKFCESFAVSPYAALTPFSNLSYQEYKAANGGTSGILATAMNNKFAKDGNPVFFSMGPWIFTPLHPEMLPKEDGEAYKDAVKRVFTDFFRNLQSFPHCGELPFATLSYREVRRV